MNTMNLTQQILSTTSLAEAHQVIEDYINDLVECDALDGYTREDYEKAVGFILFEDKKLQEHMIAINEVVVH
ncbi:hypothetical protein ACJYIO_001190 [Vibrio parahaemolyticus]